MKVLEVKENDKRLLDIPLAKIVANPHQPRKRFSDGEIAELSESIAAHGLLQPITVRASQDLYVLIAGERRVLACKRLGFHTISAIMICATEVESAIYALVENIQRSALDYFEEADAIQKLLRLTGMRQDALAAKLGKAPSTIANKVRLCAIPEHLRQLLVKHGVSERHARALLKTSHDLQLMEKAAHYICQQKPTAAQTEQYVDILVCSRGQEKKSKQIHKLYVQDTRLFMNTLKKAVSTMKLAGFDICTDTMENDEYMYITMQISKKAQSESLRIG